MAKKSKEIKWHAIGHYCFFIGVILALLFAFVEVVGKVNIDDRVLVTTLFIVGLIVGLINITAKETTAFLLAAVSLLLAGIVNLELIYGVGLLVRQALTNVVIFIVPSIIIVSLKVVWKLASD